MKQPDLREAPGFKAIFGARAAAATVDQFHSMAYAEFWHSYERCIRLNQAIEKGGHVNHELR